ncbi:DUF4856 domain-containing protein [Aureibacter tunicatorum]|uniref:DUF4856 domain-containing protein n=1 Tax=Aureibacter tunicatorum TaxID=866807 RepID=A0AAE3XIY8_9BACT|nr:DUF4856 domain-containing protein [Aureibacter tunicatorum]MDR6237588.1 hypothetical protein [Aureibacter tunicatorum]BDD02622.1 hypothetical protein AUTU_01050 [Aureibacter tunicatorum]
MRRNFAFLAIAAMSVLSSCKYDNEYPPSGENYDNTTYNYDTDLSSFESVNAQALRLIEEMEKGHDGAELSESVLLGIYKEKLAVGASLMELTSPASQDTVEFMIKRFASISSLQQQGENGKPGLTSLPSGSSLLLDGNGMNYAKLVEKELMGAVIYFNEFSEKGYLSSIREEVNNNKLNDSTIARNEMSWDAAFGFTGTRKSEESSTYYIDPSYFWGNEWAKMNQVDGSNTLENIYGHFVRGRRSISYINRDTLMMDIQGISNNWELSIARKVEENLSSALDHSNQSGLRAHDLSAALGSIRMLPHNIESKMDSVDSRSISGKLGENFYETTDWQIQEIRKDIVFKYPELEPYLLKPILENVEEDQEASSR